MGVMLNPSPTEQDLARRAGLVPGSDEEARFLQMRADLDQKGFITASLDDLTTWARTGSLWWMTFFGRCWPTAISMASSTNSARR